MSVRFIQPCSPVTAQSVPAGDAWLYEPKLDSYRLQVLREGRTVRLFSRRGDEWTGMVASDCLTAMVGNGRFASELVAIDSCPAGLHSTDTR
jgi:ATP-dependent DNA ligase